jgi:hypothetical protein
LREEINKFSTGILKTINIELKDMKIWVIGGEGPGLGWMPLMRRRVRIIERHRGRREGNGRGGQWRKRGNISLVEDETPVIKKVCWV